MKLSTVLFLAANPLRVQPLQLGEECRAIEAGIRGSKFRNRVRVRSRWAARPDDLLQALNEDAPSVLHFSGHGAGDHGVCFQAEDGSAVSVSADGLARVLFAAGSSVMLVVLNACYTEVQAQALVERVPCVIGMSAAIGDDAAIRYAASLYRALAFGRSIANAHQQGLAALALRPAGDQLRDVQLVGAGPRLLAPRLLTRPNVDADRVYLVQPPVAGRLEADRDGASDEVAAGNQSQDGRGPRSSRSGTSTENDQTLRLVEVHHLEPAEGASVIFRIDRTVFRRRSTVTSTDGEPSFTGRDDELRSIEDLFHHGRIVVLHGGPGLGKSRLAKEYAQRHSQTYPGGIFLVPFAQLPPVELARLLRDTGQPVYAGESFEDQCRRALFDLGSEGRVLIIYDAVADERTLRGWLPYEGLEWHLLVTSTSASWAASWSTVKLGALHEPAAHALVARILANGVDAARLAEAITEKAAGITSELRASAAAAYEQLRRGRPVEATTGELGTETIASFGAAWCLLSRNAQIVLGVVSQLGASRVPAGLIASTLQSIGWSASAVEAAIDEVRDRSLATGDATRVDVHPLVARFVRSRESLPEGIRRRLPQELTPASGSVLEARGAFVQRPEVPSGRPSEVHYRGSNPRPRLVRWITAWPALAAAAAVFAVVLVMNMSRSARSDAFAFAMLPHRSSEIRLAYGGAAEYRPYAAMRSGGSPQGRISWAKLADTETRDRHVLAIAMAVNGASSMPPNSLGGSYRRCPPEPIAPRSRSSPRVTTRANRSSPSSSRSRTVPMWWLRVPPVGTTRSCRLASTCQSAPPGHLTRLPVSANRVGQMRLALVRRTKTGSARYLDALGACGRGWPAAWTATHWSPVSSR